MPDSPLTQRDVESLRTTLTTLDRTINDLRRELVSKEVYSVSERARDAAMNDMKDDMRDIKNSVTKIEERRAADRRLLMTSFALPLVLLLINLYLASQVSPS
jgi:hypothetical protein